MSDTRRTHDQQRRQGDQEAMGDQRDSLRDKLEKKNLFIDQERHFRATAENDSRVYLKKIKQVEIFLEAERQRNLAYEKELHQCTGDIEELHQSLETPEEDTEVKSKYTEAQKLALDEIEKLKKQLEEETAVNLEVTSKLRANEGLTKGLELESAELTAQLKSAIEKVPELIGVSTQTENLAFEKVFEHRELFNLHVDKIPTSKKFIPSRNHVAPEKLTPELVGTSEKEVISDPTVPNNGVSEQKPKKRRRRGRRR